MKRGFFNFMKQVEHKRRNFIFDLDKTLWDFTVETSPSISLHDIKNYVHRDRRPILKTIKDEGHLLNIASRSKNPTKCLQFLDAAFPDIHFTSKQIFFTPIESKQRHIDSIFVDTHEFDLHTNNPWDPFYFFDDEGKIINDIEQKYKLKHCFHTPNGLHYGTFKAFL